MTFVDQAVRGVMTGVYAGVGTAGFSEFDYPGLYYADEFNISWQPTLRGARSANR